MSIINEVCGVSGTSTKNMGGKKQCLEAPVKTVIVAKDTFAFANVAAMKDVANYDSAIAAKDLVPFPSVEGIELANTEAIIKNGRYTDYTLKAGVAGVAYRFDLSICTYDALKSFVNSGYTRIFEITESEEVTCEVQDDGTVKGRKLNSFLVGQRNQATDADVPFTNVNLKFDDDVYDIVRAEFDASEVEGVYDVSLTIDSANATTIVLSAALGCSGDNVASLTQANFKYLEADGQEETITGLSYDAETGKYTITAAAFVTGTIQTNGVVTQTNIKYEAAATAVTVS